MAGRSLKGDKISETLAVLESWQGIPLNYSKMGKQLNISCSAAKARVHDLVQSRIIWLLLPLQVRDKSTSKRTRKSPKLYFTKAGEALLPAAVVPGRSTQRISKPQTATQLHGRSRLALRPLALKQADAPSILQFRIRMIRKICSLEAARNPSSTFWYYGGYGKTHVELIIQTSLKRIGFVFLPENLLSRWCWSYCRRVFRQDIIQAAFVLYPGHRIFYVSDRLVALPTGEFFKNYRRWLNACLGSSRKLLQRMVREYNDQHAHHLP